MKQETLEEVAERLYPIILEDDGWDKNKQYRDEWIEGAKWQAERSYSDEEVKSFLNSIISEINSRRENIITNQDKMPVHLLEGGLMAFEASIDAIKEMFEQFKKK